MSIATDSISIISDNKKRLLRLANEILSNRKQESDISDFKILVKESIKELNFSCDKDLFERVLRHARDVIRQGPEESVALIVENFVQSYIDKSTEDLEALFKKEIKHLLNFKWPINDSNMISCNFPRQFDNLLLQIINNDSKLAEFALKTIMTMIKCEINSNESCQSINKIIHLYKLGNKLCVIYKFKQTNLEELKKVYYGIHSL